MGWETRANGHRYLYRSVRRDGRIAKEYLGADDAIGRLAAAELALSRAARDEHRAAAAAARDEFRGRLDELAALVAAADADLRAAAHGVLVALGFHRHHRGEWRMKRLIRDIERVVKQLEANQKNPARC
jgi:hypothetical protein